MIDDLPQRWGHRPIPYRLHRTVYRCASKGWHRLALSLILKARKQEIFFYAHCGHIPASLLAWLRERSFLSCDPVTASPEEVQIYHDPERVAWCGAEIGGKPVTHRSGDLVMVGVGTRPAPRKWKRAAPKKAQPAKSTVRKSAEPGGGTRQFTQRPVQKPPIRARVRVAGGGVKPVIVKQSESWLHWWQRVSTGYKVDYFDPALRFAAEWTFPAHVSKMADSRQRSRNLGRLVDGFCGWGADLAAQVPIIGGLTGGIARGAAKIVRLGEELVNLVTSPMGFSLFLLSLLSVVGAQPAGYASHLCRNPNGTYFISNACRTSEVSFCSDTLCWHRHGCVPCVNGTCWKRMTNTVSSSPQYNGVAWDLVKHADFVVVVTYACETMWMSEPCAAALLFADWVIEFWGVQHAMNECCVCNEVDSAYRNTFYMFFSGLTSQSSLLGLFFDLLERLPNAIFAMFASAHWGFICVGLAYFLDGRTTRVAVLLIVYMLIIPSNAQVLHPRCSRSRPNGSTHQVICFDPVPKVYITSSWMNGTNFPYPRRNTQCHTYDLRNNTYLDYVCQFRSGRRGCKNCTGDCFHRHPSLTYDRCGVGPWINEDVLVWDPILATHFHNVSNWDWSYIMIGGKAVTIRCNPNRRYERMVRMPFFPRLATTTTTYACQGHAFMAGELATGFITKTPAGNRQIFAGERIVSNLPILEHNFLVLCLLHMCGSRFVSLAWFLAVIYMAQAAVGHAAIVVFEIACFGGLWWVCAGLWCVFCTKPKLLEILFPFAIVYGNRVFLLALWLVCQSLGFTGVAGFSLVEMLVPGPAVSFSEYVACCLFLLSFIVCSSTPGMKRHRATTLWTLAYIRERVCFALGEFTSITVTEEHLMIILSGICMYKPLVVLEVLSIVFSIVYIFDLLWACFILSLRSRLHVYRILSFIALIDKISLSFSQFLTRFVFKSASAAGIFFYDHLHHLSDAMREAVEGVAVTLDPVMFSETEVQMIVDDGRRLACGDVVNGLPVVARSADMVMCGFRAGAVPDGWRLSAPLVVTKHDHRSMFSVMAMSLTGVDKTVHQGQICRLGTALTTSMGFGYAGSLLTTRHGSRCRGLASAVGSTTPIGESATNDSCVYPLPQGMGCLDACTCSPKDCWFIDRTGELRSVTRSGNNNWWVVLGGAPYTAVKGASGGPLMCAAGHAVGMVTKCKHIRRAVTEIHAVPLDACVSVAPPCDYSGMSTPPRVPAQYAVYNLYAPTGSGKSTRVPYQYVQDGYKTLVLNPSVATTSAMGPYMASAYGITPNVYFGESSVTTGSMLSYATYGKYLAMGDGILAGVDVVICDECHSTDATSVLGIAHVLSKARVSGVKCVVLATATPPGIPLSKHTNITELALDGNGDIPFYGKTLRSDNYLTGRHLVFCSSKRTCTTVTAALKEKGINAVSYWRGVDKAVIPLTGDCVVVSTDALMTGYTGNFDTVTDCCVSTHSMLEVDLAPTFRVGVVSAQADTVTRMQRRGRTGRGKPGVYRYCDPHAALSGIVYPDVVVEAYDTGMSWYDFSPKDITNWLKSYMVQPGLPVVKAELAEWEAVYLVLARYNRSPHLLTAKQNGLNFALLTAAQVEVSRAAGAHLPGRKGRWEHYPDTGTSVCPLVCSLDVEVDDYVEDSAVTRSIQAALGLDREEESSALLYVGAGLVACCVVIDNTASIVVTQNIIVGTHDLLPEGLSANVYDVDCPVIEESSSYLPYDWCVTNFGPHVDRLRSMLSNTTLPSRGWLETLTRSVTCHLGSLLSVSTYSMGLATVRRNPILGGACAFAAGFTSSLPLTAKLFISLAGGSLAAQLTSVKPSCFFALAGAAGAACTGLGIGKLLFSVCSTYGAATEVAALLYGLLNGQYPKLEECAGLLFACFNPGAAVVGAVLAVVLTIVQRKGDPAWTNRLLAMCAKTSVIPPGFFLESESVAVKVSKLLRALTPTTCFNKLAAMLDTGDVSECSAGLWRSVYDAVLRLLYGLKNWATAKVASFAPKVPLMSCQKPWRGPWAGTGSCVTTCTCGTKLVYSIADGAAKLSAKASRCCCSALFGGVPINVNTRYTAGVRPLTSLWKTCAVFTGTAYVFYERLGTAISVVGATDEAVDWGLTPPCEADISYVDGVVVNRLETGLENPTPLYTNRITLGAYDTTLPFVCVDLPPQPHPVPAKPSPAPPRRVTWNEVELVELRPPSPGGAASQESETVPLLNEQAGPSGLGRPGIPGPHTGGLRLRHPSIPLEWCHQLATIPSRAPSVIGPDMYPEPTFPTNNAINEFDFVAVRNVHNHVHHGCDVHNNSGSICSSVGDQSATSHDSMCHRAHMGTRIRLSPRNSQFLGSDGSLSDTPVVPVDTALGEVVEETSYSYIWNGVPAWIGTIKNRVLPVRVSTDGLGTNKSLAYYTEPTSVDRRIAKVTKWRSCAYTPSYFNFLAVAKRKAAAYRARELTFDEVKGGLHSAPSDLTGLTSAEVRAGTPRARKLVMEAYNGITEPTSRFRYTTLMPKSEIFVRTPEFPATKPPRMIIYPPLEMRVAEKMVMGDVAPSVVKAILGESYGFQYSPADRTKFLVKHWTRRQSPVGIACDTICFDSTVTPQDVSHETAVYASACRGEHRRRVQALGDTLYTTSEMRNNRGQVIGVRHCRASGVFTTSTSNCLTVWIKVRAAMADAGIRDATLLVNGDDVVMIFDSDGVVADREKAAKLEACLNTLGMPQNACKPVYSLELLTVCSSNVSVATSHIDGRTTYYLTRDPTTPLGRALVETTNRSPVGSWMGYILQHYPSLWASRVVMVHWLDMVSQTVGYTGDTTLTIEWSNRINLQLKLLPYILTALHGRPAMCLKNFTPREVSRVGRVLHDLGYQPLSYWRRRARFVRAALLKKGGIYAFLAIHLLSFAGNQLPPALDDHRLRQVSDYLTTLPPPYSGDFLNVDEDSISVFPWGHLLAGVVFFGALLVGGFLL